MTGGVVKAAPIVVDMVGKALGRTPTQQDLIDLGPVAVMVSAFCQASNPGDELTMTVETWDNTFLFGLFDNHGQKMELRILRDEEEE